MPKAETIRNMTFEQSFAIVCAQIGREAFELATSVKETQAIRQWLEVNRPGWREQALRATYELNKVWQSQGAWEHQHGRE